MNLGQNCSTHRIGIQEDDLVPFCPAARRALMSAKFKCQWRNDLLWRLAVPEGFACLRPTVVKFAGLQATSRLSNCDINSRLKLILASYVSHLSYDNGSWSENKDGLDVRPLGDLGSSIPCFEGRQVLCWLWCCYNGTSADRFPADSSRRSASYSLAAEKGRSGRCRDTIQLHAGGPQQLARHARALMFRQGKLEESHGQGGAGFPAESPYRPSKMFLLAEASDPRRIISMSCYKQA